MSDWQKMDIAEIFEKQPLQKAVEVNGWVRTFRNNRFVALSDGTVIQNLQVVLEPDEFTDELRRKITTGAALRVRGEVVESPGGKQSVEVKAGEVEVLGKASSGEYPLQPKRHSLEFLRENAHLRFRTNTFGAVFRIRHNLSYAIHQYFHERRFFYLHTPIITGSDAEGAGEMFRVTNFDLSDIPRREDGKPDNQQDFFGKETNLTVSGQLEAELAALALSKVYTFGPTFRAENSNTTRHLAEFWMVEPEMAFANLDDNMNRVEDFLKHVVQYILDHCTDDLEFLHNRDAQEQQQKPASERHPLELMERLRFIGENRFERITYSQAIEILQRSKPYKKKKFKFPVEWGTDLQSEHERYLVEKHFKTPVIITDYPASFKAFYMRLNEDGKTVGAMDVLFPGIGEITGGSQREERYDVLLQRSRELNIPKESLWWYLETRKFGTCQHSGFGLGFERLMMYVTGMANIRDVIPFPRTPMNCEF